MYNIKINNMKFHSYIGVYGEEKKLGQNLEIDLRVTMNVDPYQLNDQVTHSISYGEFYSLVEKIVSNSSANLVETIALEIIDSIKKLAPYLVEKVHVNVRKMAVPISGIFDSVEIELER